MKKRLNQSQCTRCGATWTTEKMRCPSCGLWNTQTDDFVLSDQLPIRSKPLFEYDELSIARISTGPWDFTFGGGPAVTSVNLLGGPPGAGKSTMLLQLCDGFLDDCSKDNALYISTEEAGANVKSRAIRCKVKNYSRIFFASSLDGINIENELAETRAKLVIIDSLQGLSRDEQHQLEICESLKDDATRNGRVTIVTSQVNKDEDMAGLMSLQHEVDALFLFIKEHDETRTLYAEKNRFGATPNETFYAMTETGLVLIDGDDSDE